MKIWNTSFFKGFHPISGVLQVAQNDRYPDCMSFLKKVRCVNKQKSIIKKGPRTEYVEALDF